MGRARTSIEFALGLAIAACLVVAILVGDGCQSPQADRAFVREAHKACAARGLERVDAQAGTFGCREAADYQRSWAESYIDSICRHRDTAREVRECERIYR